MAWKTPPALARLLALAALTPALAACGGGSTGGPVAQPSAATTTPAPPAEARSTPVPSPAAPSTRAATPVPQPAAQPRAERPRTAGGAAAPQDAGALADAPAPPAEEPPAPVAPPSQPAATALDERADLILTRRVTNTHYFQQGTVTGTWGGTMATEARITSRGVLVKFTATLPGGTISGRAVAVAILDSVTWPGLRGRAKITGGTGRFAGIEGRELKVTGRSKPDASRTRVRLRGTVRLP